MQRDELMAVLRLYGITDVRDVARAYLEANGIVSVIRAEHAEPEDVAKPRALGDCRRHGPMASRWQQSWTA